MESTDVFGYPCIGEQDYAGIPIYMKSLGLQIEENLSTQQAALESFMDVGSAIWEATFTQTFPDGFHTNINTINTQVGGAGLVQSIAGQPTLPPLRGWYYFGATVNLVPVGAYTAGSVRNLVVSVTTLGLSIGTQEIGLAKTLARGIPNPPGDALWCANTCFHDGLSTAHVNAFVYHNQTFDDLSSTLTPPARIFIAYLGDSPDIRELS